MSGVGEVPQVEAANARKPDPSEPWRYVCPDCESQVDGHVRTLTYYCRDCGESYRAPQLYDKKTDRYGVSFHT